MTQEHYYEVHVKWKEGRIGELSSPVLNTNIECATPPEFASGVPNIWSPEHLFGAAINSCYMATFLAIAENFKLPFTEFECKTICKLEWIDKKYRISKAVISPVVKLENKEWEEKALRVLEKSKQNCLVTNSINTEIMVDPKFI